MLTESFSLVVTTGYNGYTVCPTTEVINFNNDQNKIYDLPDHPEKVYAATGGLVGETFLCCGGGNEPKTAKASSDKCYKLGLTNPVAVMSKKRKFAASVVVKDQLWVTGGCGEDGEDLKSTEFVDPANGSVKPGPDLPVATSSHCIVLVGSTTVLLIGGIGAEKKTWFYNFDSPDKGWVKGPDLNEGRWSHVCGVIKDSADEEKRIVIAAGGYNGKDGIKSTEFLVLGSQPQKWTKGPDLPNRIGSAAGVVTPDEKSFLVVGGYNKDTNQNEDSIYKLQCHNLTFEWTKLDQKLRVARSRPVAAFVPDSVLDSL